MDKIKAIFSLALFGLALNVSAQEGHIRRGDKHFEDFSYVDAIASYEGAAMKGASESAVASKLAMSYWKLRELDKAEMWYAKAVAAENATSEDLYRYAEVLRSNGKYADADTWLNKYNLAVGDDSRVALQQGAASYAPQLQVASLDKATVVGLTKNSSNCDMSPMLMGDKLFLASARSMEVNARRRHTWNDKPFLDIYECTVSEDGQVTSLNAVKGVNTSYHESNAAFTADGKTMYFTRNNVHKGKKQLTSEKVNNLKIFSRTLTSEGWSNEKNFPYNSNEYSVGHPTLTADGQTLFFASDMTGGQGGTDIWMVEREGDSWSKPTNLGTNVNTRGNEMFPFIHEDGLLFFASDGHKGLGGLDILYTNLNKGNAGPVKNPGAPINSGTDDFSLVLNPTSTRGYFTSNRSGGQGDDDVYLFNLSAPFGGSLALSGMAINALTQEPLANAHVDLKDAAGTVIGTVVTGADGSYLFPLEADQNVQIVGSLPEYREGKESASTTGMKDMDSTLVRNLMLLPENAMALAVSVKNRKTGDLLDGVDVEVIEAGTNLKVINGRTGEDGGISSVLNGKAPGDELSYTIKYNKKGFIPVTRTYKRKIESVGEVLILEDLVPIEVGGDLAKMIDIEPIYFDLNKDNIRPDAATELNKIVTVMKENPSMVIELGSHTDSRGSDNYNEKLSDRRAKSSAAYIVKQGIATERITGKGYGEAKLVNRCGNGVKCSKTEHQANRRTEFIIVKM